MWNTYDLDLTGLQADRRCRREGFRAPPPPTACGGWDDDLIFSSFERDVVGMAVRPSRLRATRSRPSARWWGPDHKRPQLSLALVSLALAVLAVAAVHDY